MAHRRRKNKGDTTPLARNRAYVDGWFWGTAEAIRVLQPSDEQLGELLSLWVGSCVYKLGGEANAGSAVASVLNAVVDGSLAGGDKGMAYVQERLRDWLGRHAVPAEDM